jgi:hypothetical protein
MRVVDLPRDTWLVVEALAAGDVKLVSTHTTQRQAEAERDERNRGLCSPRFSAIRTLAPAAGAQGCGAVLMQK